MKIKVPEHVEYIINTLIENGYEAYAVGGCVRDTILNRMPGDWDITTSAKPEQVKALFKRTIDTGIEHGTVTVMLDKVGYEVTTYRIDGEYEDNRHPKSVEFTSNLVEDLKRRDFTINAMAYNDKDGIVDEFCGLEDINRKVIRCVGTAGDRFDEDALRIMRAVRFAAQLGFSIEEETTKAIEEKAVHLKNISAERIRVELVKLLISEHPELLVTAYDLGITKVMLPEFDLMMETGQANPHHIYNVGMHTIKSIEAMKQIAKGNYSDKEYTILCLTMLLHDAGKPKMKVTDETGRDRFVGHPEESAIIAKDVLRRLRFDNHTIDVVTKLVLNHDYRIEPKAVAVRRASNKIGLDYMPYLFLVQRADVMAQNPTTQQEKLERIAEVEVLYKELCEKQQCVQLKDLAISGRDLIEHGLKPGKELGEILNKLLVMVIEQPELNTKDQLLDISETIRMS
ncbi:MAG: CCA tRNA nucleotidyltransferase [bacterium]|nr:CCA tRNA nucleotidyltransferase [bacterium]